jgi:hypothetical protein
MMEENDFDSMRLWRRFGKEDVRSAERMPALALALWGRAPEDLRQQLLASAPRVPPGCSLAELRQLARQAKHFLAYYQARVHKFPTTLSQLHPNEIIVIGSQRLNTLEARCEVVRRAIDHLERRA